MSDMTRRTILASSAALVAGGAVQAQADGTRTPPQPIEGDHGASDLGPRDVVRDEQSPDLLTPPRTDKGLLPNLRFSFADAHMNLQDGGWAREVTQRELPVASELAGVNMRLKPSGARELHWHKQAEWAFMLAGRARITAVDNEGRNFIADVGQGDLWYFPAGLPHSIQGLGPDGCEFLLVFPDGQFSESSTFLISELFARTPKDVLAKNFGVAPSAFDRIPKEQLFIFNAAPPAATIEADAVPSPQGTIPSSMVFRLMEQAPARGPKGWVRIADTTNFPISTEVAAALVNIEPGGMREIHWHQNADEWQYYISGRGRMTVFASEDSSRTFDYKAGDVGYVQRSMSHYIENTGTEPLRFLEMFRANKFVDVSLNQWMALTPQNLIRSHLNLDQATIDVLSKTKKLIV